MQLFCQQRLLAAPVIGLQQLEATAAAAPAANAPAFLCCAGVMPSAAVPAVLAAVAASADCWALVMPVRLPRAAATAPATTACSAAEVKT